MEIIAKRVRFILELEMERIRSRGLINNLIGWGMLLLIFTLIPALAKSLWPEHIEKPFLFYAVCTTIILNVSTPLYTLIYLPCKTLLI